jgi:hypothetical protein
MPLLRHLSDPSPALERLLSAEGKRTADPERRNERRFKSSLWVFESRLARSVGLESALAVAKIGVGTVD